MYDALMLGALLVSLLFEDLSDHSYPSAFFFYSKQCDARMHCRNKSTDTLPE